MYLSIYLFIYFSIYHSKDDNGGLPEFWLSLFRSWLVRLQAAFDLDFAAGLIDEEGWKPAASDDGILAYKLLVQTGHVDFPVDKSLLRHARYKLFFFCGFPYYLKVQKIISLFYKIIYNLQRRHSLFHVKDMILNIQYLSWQTRYLGNIFVYFSHFIFYRR